MPLFSSSKNKDEYVLYFDIGSGSVGGALARLRGKKREPEILHTVRVPLVFQADAGLPHVMSRMEQAFRAAVGKMAAAYRGPLSGITCFLRSPWYASQTRVIRFERSAPFVFSERLASDLISRELLSFEKEELSGYADLGSSARVVEKHAVETKLNGYATADPYGKKATSLELTLYLSMSPEAVLRALEDAIRRSFAKPPIRFATFLLSSYVVARDALADEADFVMVDVGSEITELSLVKGGLLLEAVSFPVGKNAAIRRMAKSLSKTFDEAASLLSMFRNGQLQEDAGKDVGRALADAELDWLHAFEDALVRASGSSSLPSRLLLVAPPEWAEWFSRLVAKEKLSQYALTEKQFSVSAVSPLALKQYVAVRGQAAHDPLLMVEAMHVARVHA